MKGLFGDGGLIRSLEADESVNVLTFVVAEHLKALDFTILLEALSKLFFSSPRREILNVQIASLLGVLVLEHFTSSLDSSALLLKSFLDIKLLTIDFAVIELLDSLLSGFRSIFSVILILRVVANESVNTLVVLAKLAAFNATICTEKLAKFSFFVALRQVLNIDVVINTAEVAFVLRLIFDTDVVFFVSSVFESLL